MKNKIIILLLCTITVFSFISVNVSANVYASAIKSGKIYDEDSKNIEKLISKMIEAENKQDWETFISYWCKSEADIFKSLFSNKEYIEERNGVLTVDSAKLEFMRALTIDEMNNELSNFDYSDYNEIRAYVVGINYEVAQVTNNFYNGTNYRIIVVIKENNRWKVINRSEASLDYLNIIQPEIAEDDIETAIDIRDARSEGYVIDSDYSIQEVITDDQKGHENNEIEYWEPCEEESPSLITTFGLNPGYTYTTACSCKRPLKIKVYDSGAISTVDRVDYIKNVLPNEMIISKTGNEESLKTQVICIQQYVVFNTIYYSKYPDKGYDVNSDTSDQKYVKGSYNALLQTYKDKVDAAYNAVANLHVVTGSHKSLFQTGYRANSETYNGIAVLSQNGALALSQDGKKVAAILRYYYDYKAQQNISNIGYMTFHNYK